jgi:hypothetical protein
MENQEFQRVKPVGRQNVYSENEPLKCTFIVPIRANRGALRIVMRKIVILIFLFSFLSVSGFEAGAQVRVRRGMGDPKPKKLPRPKKARSVKSGHEQVTIAIRPPKKRPVRTELDGMFYVPWQAARGLRYTDFLYNRNLYNKFLPSRDTDLTSIIYPDYREFYNKLTERLKNDGALYEDYWQEKIMYVMSTRADTTLQIDAIPDTGYTMTISIDSPAASVISILPAIYPIDEHTYYFNITALFNKYESWMIVKSKDILIHEQIHFDIFELYARKMRKYLVDVLQTEINTDLPNALTNKITPVYEVLYQELNDMQLEFDRQTGEMTSVNASLIKLNERWRSSLKSQIDGLKEYAIPEGTITVR